MRRLDKDESRKRWAELRALWNEYDPIGVRPQADSPQDEYDSYVGATMRLLEEDATVDLIHDAMVDIVCVHMGLENSDQERMRRYAQRFIDWYNDKWAGTRV